MRTLNRTLLCVSIALVGAAGCASSGGIKPPAQPPATGKEAITPPDSARRRSTRIAVSRPDDSKECTATIDDDIIIGKRGKKVAWLVEDFTAGKGCFYGTNWHIEVRFHDADWNHGNDPKVKIDRDDIKAVRIHPQAAETRPGMGRKYKVWLVYSIFSGGEDKALIDPELEIER